MGYLLKQVKQQTTDMYEGKVIVQIHPHQTRENSKCGGSLMVVNGLHKLCDLRQLAWFFKASVSHLQNGNDSITTSRKLYLIK